MLIITFGSLTNYGGSKRGEREREEEEREEERRKERERGGLKSGWREN